MIALEVVFWSFICYSGGVSQRNKTFHKTTGLSYVPKILVIFIYNENRGKDRNLLKSVIFFLMMSKLHICCNKVLEILFVKFPGFCKNKLTIDDAVIRPILLNFFVFNCNISDTQLVITCLSYCRLFIVNFKQISHLFLVFPLLTLNK